MKTNIFTLFAFIFITIGLNSPLALQGSNRAGITSKNEIVNPADSLQIIEQQKEFLSWKFGMFIHFNVATFNEREWANGYEDPLSFSPDKLDCNQWAEVAKEAGMKYAVLTVKHTGGWCLWDSKFTTSHDVTAFKKYKNGNGDIVKEFVDACRKHGIKVGLYYCFPGNYSGRWGNTLPEGKPDLHGLPPEVEGDYVGFIKKQLTELMTNYGKIDLIWIDQFTNKYTRSSWPEIRRHIKSHQPNCLVIGNNATNFENSDILGYEYPYWKDRNPDKALPPKENTKPSEVCDKIGPGWFWSSEENSANLKPAKEILEMLNLSNKRTANYLLNIAPDNTGLIPEHTIQRLKEFRVLFDKH
jgi:alpha-L-fucosidase